MTSPRLQHTEHMSTILDPEFIHADRDTKLSASPSCVIDAPRVFLFITGREFQASAYLTPGNARLIAAQLLSAAEACENEGKLQRA